MARSKWLVVALLCHCGPSADVAPQVHDYGGPVLAQPSVVPVFFANDAEQPAIETFLNALSRSSYWTQATSEYGVGALAIGASVVTSNAAPPAITSADVERWLVAQRFVSPDRVYAVFYPAETTIVNDDGEVSCARFGGYHGEARNANGESVVYVAMPRCATFGDLRGLDALTSALSHELVEAATDPLVRTKPAYAAVDAAHMVWNLMPLGEIGDLCSYDSRSYDRLVGSFMVQRVWSNASAKAGHDPCVPAPDGPYLRAVPVLTDTVPLVYGGREVTTRGVSVPIGESRTIDVRLEADGPTDDWTVTATDATTPDGEPAEL
ncbi:MAG TPA: hypothetical protein VGH87_04530, partial [Polyangiaceae bacterium]